MIVENLQNIIFNIINNIEDKKIYNIYTSIQKNTNFPYIVIESKNIKSKYCLNTFLHFVNLKIKILDKNNINYDVVKKMSEIQKNILKVINKQFENYTIIDIKKDDEELNIDNNINSIWQGVLSYTVLLEEKNGK